MSSGNQGLALMRLADRRNDGALAEMGLRQIETAWDVMRDTKLELRQLLGYETIYELDAFLKAHGVFDPCTLADLERERQNLDRLGF
jgi:hypothetical protein